MTTSPTLWIVFPFTTGIFLLFLKEHEKETKLAALLVLLILTILAFGLPINQPITFRFWPGFPSFIISDSLIFFGARFTIDQSVVALIAFLYLSMTFWVLISYNATSSYLLIPLSFIVMSLIVSGLSINPRAYASLVLLLAALLCVPLFSPPGKQSHPGVIQFMLAQIVGMALILIANLIFVSASIQSESQFVPPFSIIFLLLGFALVVPIFPFHSWLIQLSSKGGGPGSRYFLIVFPLVNLTIFFEAIIRMDLPTTVPFFNEAIRSAGLFLLVFGGLAVAVEQRMERAFGFIILHQVGLLLLSISLATFANNNEPAKLFFAFIIQIVFCMLTWRLADVVFHPGSGSSSKQDYSGGLIRSPFASIALLLCIFSFAGLPALPGFPIQLDLWRSIAQIQPNALLFGIFGNFLVSIFGIRLLRLMIFQNHQPELQTIKRRILDGFLIVAIIFLILISLFPAIYTPLLLRMANFIIKPIP